MIQFIIATLTLLVLDGIWLGLIAKPLYMDTIGKLMRVSDGSLQPIWLAGAIVYFALILGIVVFVIPKANGRLLPALLWGGLFGLLTYTIYDFTNLAILADWSLKISIIDVIWGCIVCGLTSLITVFITRQFFG